MVLAHSLTTSNQRKALGRWYSPRGGVGIFQARTGFSLARSAARRRSGASPSPPISAWHGVLFSMRIGAPFDKSRGLTQSLHGGL